MIREGEKIRLSAKELAQFRKDTGRTTPPETASEYNDALERAARNWELECDGLPEAMVIAMVLREGKLPAAGLLSAADSLANAIEESRAADREYIAIHGDVRPD